MSAAVTSTVQQLQLAHEIADTCGSISQNLPKTAPDEKLGKAATVPDGSLTAQQCLAIGHLVAGKSYGETAELVRVNRRTLYEWRKSPAFIARLNESARESLDVVATRTRNLLLRGTAKLERSLQTNATFTDTLRVVSNKRVWEMANIFPDFPGQEPQASEDKSA